MAEAVLTLNAGSSSLKFALFEAASDHTPETLKLRARGQVEGLGEAPRLTARDADGHLIGDKRWQDGASLPHEEFLEAVFDFCDAHLGSDRLVACGHRIVHGGDLFSAPARLTPAVMAQLEGLDALAPLHQPHNLSAARAAMAARPEAPQIGVFDTAFHQTICPLVRRYGLPFALEDKGIHKYGFHGLSYTWLTRRLRAIDHDLASRRIIFAHLGAGASLCATVDGQSCDTTMGFTALDGLVMSTRSGSVDPGVVLHLMSAEGMNPSDITKLLYYQSGLLGVSGVSGDVRTLLASKAPRASAAIELFCYRAAREIGSLAITIGGLDGLVFSAGIGENAAIIRRKICAYLGWMGLYLSPANESPDQREWRISSPDSPILAFVIPTDEERIIAAGALSACAV